ncbi:phage head spike fiber domain-containing protein [Sphingomonas sp.]|jgi:hypothetical protein|uniref:phage head spike fiber domain-containing protein n=1 Tax=Sphingomonas sp. TaxID=28214 RepID=UPI002E2F7129|nr:hypothetical protein [Sphingomonas sp.]HEX4695714.1 hypothetical protein [Sphingomonas sp.]
MTALGFGTGFRLNRRGAAGFDFGGGVLPAGASLARGSAGTRCDVGGAIVSAAANVARFDYDPASHAPRGLLVEAAATNVVIDSQDWTTANWTRTGVTATATRLTETSGGTFHRTQEATADRVMTIGAPVVVSCIASDVAGSAKRYLGLNLVAVGFGSPVFAVFDLAAGAVAAVSNGTAGIEAAPGGWLCWVSGTPTASVANGREFYCLSNVPTTANASYAGDGASAVNVSEAQFETGTVPSSRVRSGASAGTRSADVVTLAGASGTWRFGFDDGSVQDAALVASGGVVSVPTGLNRARIMRVALL